ncbi:MULTISPECIES: hypothetical protein [Helicobacter]|uniref:hypothetical protein n=2 Tax=Helicobacter TaxID=209 RepID=UPI00260F8603|nr:hypothetical protein [Helicobacter sp. UBA3407]
MVNKMKKWIKSAAGIVSITLFVISIILLLVAICLDYENFSNNINNTLFSLVTNLLGIIITISFVQHFIDRQNEKDEHIEENSKIKRYDRFMNVLMIRYSMYLNCVVTPIKRRSTINPLKLSSQFEFEDMCDLYKCSLYLCEGISKSSIESFYEIEEILRNYMIDMIQNIDFKYNKELERIIMEFVKKSIEYDMRGAILGNMTAYFGKEKMIDIAMKYIKDPSHDWLGKLQRGELDSNMMVPYVQLYKLLKIETELIKKCKDYMATLDNQIIV